MKNIIIAGVIIVIGAVVFFTHPFKGKAPENVDVVATTTTTVNTETKLDANKTPVVTVKISPEDAKMIKELQDIWNKYLLSAKNHDVKTLASLSYQLSDNCKDLAKTEKQCFEAMDQLATIFAEIKTTDFKIVWFDKKQAVLMTEQRPTTLDGNPGFKQPRIFFGVKDGAYKLLAIFPDWGRFANKSMLKASDIPAFLQKGALDSDKDGFTDMEEDCDSGGGVGSIDGCKKTDPHNRDENRNGWWDGVEAYIRPITN